MPPAASSTPDTQAWTSKGTGGYYTTSWKKGDPIILHRNPYYWKTTPAIDEVDIEYIPDDNTRILKLQEKIGKEDIREKWRAGITKPVAG